MNTRDNDFSLSQLERRAVTLAEALKACAPFLAQVSDENVRLAIRKQINECFINVYNAGFVDHLNETQESVKYHE